MFNALKCAKNLEEVGIPREQAEAHVQMISEIIEMNLATKEDMQALRIDISKDMLLLEQRMTIKLGTIVSLAIGIAVALSRLVH